MKIIKLTQGKVAYVDDIDYEQLKHYKWQANKFGNSWYAVTTINGKTIGMHRLILNTPDGFDCDHINSNGLENRRFNLRNCTHAENLQNRRPNYNAVSKHKGVIWHKPTTKWCARKWCARIMIDGKLKHLGLFTSEDEAGIAYNIAAIKHYGEFARLNIIVKPGENYRLFA